MTSLFSSVVVLYYFLLTFTCSRAAIHTELSHLPRAEYDYVVVGGGTAGSVIGARLSENPLVSVLLIEAGPSDAGILGVEVPLLAQSNIPFSSITWNYTTTPQDALDGRVLDYARGRVLGGSSSINFLLYTRGSDQEYDFWANVTEDSGWSWNSVSKYYLKNSRLVQPSDNHNTAGQVNPLDHGFGPVEISVPGFASEIDQRVIDTSKSHSVEFPFNLDMNSGNAVGVGLSQSTVGNGARSNAARAYLDPVLRRPNLDILLNNTVTRLLPTESVADIPTLKKVEISANATAKRSTVTAIKEVILSAGSIGTPHILMLSGVGNATALRAVGIEPLVDNPDVGQNLQDHPIAANYWNVSTKSTIDDILFDPTLTQACVAQWQTNRTGPCTDSVINSVAFLRLPKNATIFQNFSDPAAGPNSANIEFLFTDGFTPTVDPPPSTGQFLTVVTSVVSPLSRGSVTLVSTDPFVFPEINPAFLSSPFDRFAMVHAVRAARSFIETEAWDGYALDRFGSIGDALTDDDILSAVRGQVVTIWHPTSTARMSPANASWGVVDPNLLVKGVNGLRVVDASVMPKIPSCHPMAPTYIIAERAADLIKKAW